MTNDQNRPSPTSSTLLPVLSAEGAPIPVEWVEDLFARLAAILGSSMATTLAGADPERVKAEWAEALAGFTPDEVRRGIASVRLRKFAPNLPDFLHLCRPALDAENAWNEAYDCVRAKQPAWSHPAVYWAATHMGYELRNGTYAQHRKRWDALMQQQWLRGAWEALPRGLPAPKREERQAPLDGVPVSREAVTSMLHDVRQRLTGHPTREDEQQSDAAKREAEFSNLAELKQRAQDKTDAYGRQHGLTSANNAEAP